MSATGHRSPTNGSGAHAVIMLGHAQEQDHLQHALETRKGFGQATRIIMERYRIDEDRAFSFLVRASQSGNMKLREVAQKVVDRSNEKYSPI